jgi:hypothetical protein
VAPWGYDDCFHERLALVVENRAKPSMQKVGDEELVPGVATRYGVVAIASNESLDAPDLQLPRLGELYRKELEVRAEVAWIPAELQEVREGTANGCLR